jgi:hypothetical protein
MGRFLLLIGLHCRYNHHHETCTCPPTCPPEPWRRWKLEKRRREEEYEKDGTGSSPISAIPAFLDSVQHHACGCGVIFHMGAGRLHQPDPLFPTPLCPAVGIYFHRKSQCASGIQHWIGCLAKQIRQLSAWYKTRKRRRDGAGCVHINLSRLHLITYIAHQLRDHAVVDVDASACSALRVHWTSHCDGVDAVATTTMSIRISEYQESASS